MRLLATTTLLLACYSHIAWGQTPAPSIEQAIQNQAPAKVPSGAPNVQNQAAGIDFTARRVQALSDELKSPFCPGKTLTTCTSYQAFELRRELRDMINSGMTDAQIVVLLKTRHGEEISNPKQPWYTFFVPFLPFIVLAGLIFWIVQRWRRPEGEIEETPTLETSNILQGT